MNRVPGKYCTAAKVVEYNMSKFQNVQNSILQGRERLL